MTQIYDIPYRMMETSRYSERYLAGWWNRQEQEQDVRTHFYPLATWDNSSIAFMAFGEIILVVWNDVAGKPLQRSTNY